MDEAEKKLGELLRKLREEGEVSAEEFSRETRIPFHLIQALESSDFEKLPPDSYVRGLIRTYLRYFGGDEKMLFSAFDALKREKISGSRDVLPRNRFTMAFRWKFARPRIAWHPTYLIILFALFYLFSQTRTLLLPPAIQLESPSKDGIVNEANILLSGRAAGARKVFVNGEELPVSRGGAFSVDLALEEGLNSIEVVAKNYLGRERKVSRYVVYQPPSPSPAPLPSPFPARTVPGGTSSPPTF